MKADEEILSEVNEALLNIWEPRQDDPTPVWLYWEVNNEGA